MGSAVSSAVSSVVQPVAEIAGDIVGGIAGAMTPKIPMANQDAINNAIANQKILQQQMLDAYAQAQQDVTGSKAAYGGQLNQANDYLNKSNSSVDLLKGAAEGSAPSAAQAQLRSGLDAAIQSQQAMANSGNLSQMIGGQRNAMSNAANLTQQAANQSAILRANEMATARANYAQAQEQQTQNAAGLANTSLGQYQANLNQAQNYGQQAANLTGQQGNTATGQASIQQGALNQQGQIGAQITGGLLNAGGAAIGGLANSPKGAAFEGGIVPGDAKEKGDHPENDNVHVLLSPEEIVIPRSHSKSLPKAIEFLVALMEKEESKKDKEIMPMDEFYKAKAKSKGK